MITSVSRVVCILFFLFKQKTAYEMRISDWSSDVCSSDLTRSHAPDNPRRKEAGHPISHAFTRAIPTSQCMTCHMHQPNIFLNSYLGYTMWDYESEIGKASCRERVCQYV